MYLCVCVHECVCVHKRVCVAGPLAPASAATGASQASDAAAAERGRWPVTGEAGFSCCFRMTLIPVCPSLFRVALQTGPPPLLVEVIWETGT